MTNLRIFMILFLLSVIFDIILTHKTRECIFTQSDNNYNRIEIIFHLITHHFFNTFLNFGWIIDNFYIHIIHIITCIIIIIYWVANDYKCDYTIYVNKLCNWSEDKYFNDIFEIIGVKKYNVWHTVIHPLILLFIIIYSISKIIKK